MKLWNSRSFSGSWALGPGVQRPHPQQAHRLPLYANQGSRSERGARLSLHTCPFVPWPISHPARPCHALPCHTPLSSHTLPVPQYPPLHQGPLQHLRALHILDSTPTLSPPQASLRGLSSPPLGGSGTSHRPVALSAHLPVAFPLLNNYCLKADPEARTPSLCLSFSHLGPPPPTHNASLIFPIFKEAL